MHPAHDPSALLRIGRDILLIVEALISLAFIIIVMSQTTKNEGLTGTIGGQTSANFKGKPGFEERLQGYTRTLGIAWMTVAVLVALAFRGGGT